MALDPREIVQFGIVGNGSSTEQSSGVRSAAGIGTAYVDCRGYDWAMIQFQLTNIVAAFIRRVIETADDAAGTNSTEIVHTNEASANYEYLVRITGNRGFIKASALATDSDDDPAATMAGSCSVYLFGPQYSVAPGLVDTFTNIIK